MALFLSSRDTTSTEQMDDPDCDPSELENTYRQFATINSLISQWKRVYQQYIAPVARRKDTTTVLDIGFGGGDIPLKLAQWAEKDGIDLEITAVDTDRRAIDYVQKLDYPPQITFLHRSSEDLVTRGRQFDFVISNHLVHHLSESQLSEILQQTRRLSRHSVLFNDIRRSDLAYALFGLLSRPIFQSSFITRDGLTSIKRSYSYRELVDAVPDSWKVKKLFPFRLLLMHTHSSSENTDENNKDGWQGYE